MPRAALLCLTLHVDRMEGPRIRGGHSVWQPRSAATLPWHHPRNVVQDRSSHILQKGIHVYLPVA